MPPSSTSSSDPGFREPSIEPGFPKALALALGLLAIVELGVRQLPPSRLIAYDREVQARFAIRQHLQAFGPAEIGLVGSSRVHVGIVCPELRSRLAMVTGRDHSVANYASAGALIPENAPLVHFLLRSDRVPAVLLYGVGPEEIQGGATANEQSAIFWDFSDWRKARRTLGSPVDALLPGVVRNAIGDVYQTFRYRARPAQLLKQLYRGREGNPVLGERVDPEQTSDGGRSLLEHPAKEAEVHRYVDTFVVSGGRYEIGPLKVALFRELIRECRARGTIVALFETPSSATFSRILPSRVTSDLRLTMRELAAAEGVAFLTVDDLGLVLTDEDFRDPVHLNLRGATALTHALADRVLAPALAKDGGQVLNPRIP